MHWAALIFALALPAGLTNRTLAQTQSADVVSLTRLRNHVRPLLIFAPRPDDSQLEIQLHRAHDASAQLMERDVVVIAIPFNSPSTTHTVLSDSDAQAARRKFGVAPGDFLIILLGKDGGEKFRSSRPLSISRLNNIIDAMPMRQDEMRVGGVR